MTSKANASKARRDRGVEIDDSSLDHAAGGISFFPRIGQEVIVALSPAAVPGQSDAVWLDLGAPVGRGTKP